MDITDLLPEEDDDGVLEIELEDGSIVIDYDGGDSSPLLPEFSDNLVDWLDDEELDKISGKLLADVEADINSRKDWADMYVKGLDVVGLKYEERTEPWEDACGVYSTVLSEAAIRFQAEAMSETFPAAGPVKTKILGEETQEKEDAADRVKTDMNYELTEVMTEYRPEHERLLYTLGLAGTAFKKVYFDEVRGRQVAIFVPPEDVIAPYGASNLENAERITHIMRKTKNELARDMAAGVYRKCTMPDPEKYTSDIEEKKAEQTGDDVTDDDRYALCEIQVDLVIDTLDNMESPTQTMDGEYEEIEEVDEYDEEDEFVDVLGDEDTEEVEVSEEALIPAKPYIITVEKGCGKILSIRRNWLEGDETYTKRNHFVKYDYVPGFGFYGLGLIHIIGGYAIAGTSLIRQLVDAGTLSNLPGGFKTRGMRVKGDDAPIGPGEWKDVDVPGGVLRDNIMALPYKEPSQTLFALLNQITEEGRRLGAISDMNISDMSANAPVGTTLALLERTLKPMAAVQSRVHYAMKQEFKMLKRIIGQHAPDEYGYQPNRAEPRARKADYDMVEVIPVSDPNSSTMAQRVVQYQAVAQLSQQAPQIYNLPELHRQMIEVFGVKNADKIVPVEDDIKPSDPVSENMNALTGTPIKAFIYQDHAAHIATHQSFMQDPMIMQTIGQNPLAQQIMASLQAHIAEHLAFDYRKKMEEKLGVPLNAPNEEMSEEMEVQLSRVLSDAGRQLTQQNQQQAAQAEAEQQKQDPQFQQRQEELALEKSEIDRKTKKDQADAMIKAQEAERKDKQLKLDAFEVSSKIDSDADKNAVAKEAAETQTILSIIDKVSKPNPTGGNNGQ